MAKVFPTIFVHEMNSPEMEKLGIQTEFEIYKKLKNLSDDFTIFCGPKFIKRNKDGDMRDGEYSDFIIIHKSMGIAFLECKGGTIRYSSNEAKWYQNEKRLKKSPLQQASSGKFALRALLNSPKYRDEIQFDNIPSIHGAIFPNTPGLNNVQYGTDIKPEMIIWAKDCENLEKSILKILQLNRSKFLIEDKLIILIKKILYGDTLESPFRNILKYGEHAQDLEFDEAQQSFLLSVFNNQKMIIEGLAGTGKTIIAAKIACNPEYDNKKVLILTKTKGLCQFLKVLSKNKERSSRNFRVYSIDQFVKQTATRLNFPMTGLKRFSSDEEKNEHFDVYSPQLCQSIFEMHPNEKFDLVLVDEAQDFHKNWFNALNSITSEEGRIFFFYDPLQTTILNSMTEILRKPKEINFPVFNFNGNYRNSSIISNFLSKLITKYFPEMNLKYSSHSKIHVGREIELIEAQNFEDIIDKSIDKVKYLIKTEGFKGSDIVVLGVDSMRPSNYGTRKSMTSELKKLGLEVINAWDYSKPYLEDGMENNISFSDVRSFKGLEKSAVLLVNFSEVNKENIQKIYTGLSRARGDLTVITYKKALDQLKEFV